VVCTPRATAELGRAAHPPCAACKGHPGLSQAGAAAAGHSAVSPRSRAAVVAGIERRAPPGAGAVGRGILERALLPG
jgi:hypothetical protein